MAPSTAISTFTVTAEVGDVAFNEQQDLRAAVNISLPDGDGADSSSAPLSLAAVIDISGSMYGEPLDMAKKTLKFMVEQLRPTDRLSIITFGSSVYTLTNLEQMHHSGKGHALRKIEGIQVEGATNLSGGLLAGFAALQSTPSNCVASIMILTDGYANIGLTTESALKTATEQEVAKSKCPISVFTFGFGANHGAGVLRAISDSANGMYYFIKDTTSIGGAFAECLGGVSSVTCKNASILIQPSSRVSVKKIFTDAKQQTKANEISLGNLFANERRNIPILFTVPSLSQEAPEFQVAKLVFTFEGTDGVKQSYPAILNIKRSEAKKIVKAPPTAQAKEIDEQQNRVSVAEAFTTVITLAERGQMQQAETLLQNTLQQLEKSTSADQPYTVGLMEDIRNVLDSMKNVQQFKNVGLKYLYSLSRSHYQQRASGISSAAASAYMTEGQRNMLNAYSGGKPSANASTSRVPATATPTPSVPTVTTTTTTTTTSKPAAAPKAAVASTPAVAAPAPAPVDPGRLQRCVRRLMTDLVEIQSNPLPSITAEPLASDITEWHINLKAPEGNAYHGIVFHVIMQFPFMYPFQPPKLFFCSYLKHENVFRTWICLDMLQEFEWSSGNEIDKPYTGWTTAYSIHSILLQLQSFLFDKADLSSEEINKSRLDAEKFKCSGCPHTSAAVWPAFPTVQHCEKVKATKSNQKNTNKKVAKRTTRQVRQLPGVETTVVQVLNTPDGIPGRSFADAIKKTIPSRPTPTPATSAPSTITKTTPPTPVVAAPVAKPEAAAVVTPVPVKDTPVVEAKWTVVDTKRVPVKKQVRKDVEKNQNNTSRSAPGKNASNARNNRYNNNNNVQQSAASTSVQAAKKVKKAPVAAPVEAAKKAPAINSPYAYLAPSFDIIAAPQPKPVKQTTPKSTPITTTTNNNIKLVGRSEEPVKRKVTRPGELTPSQKKNLKRKLKRKRYQEQQEQAALDKIAQKQREVEEKQREQRFLQEQKLAKQKEQQLKQQQEKQQKLLQQQQQQQQQQQARKAAAATPVMRIQKASTPAASTIVQYKSEKIPICLSLGEVLARENVSTNTNGLFFSPFSFLSDELIIKIFSYVNISDLVTLSKVSFDFYTLSSSDVLWKSIYQRSFPSLALPELEANQSWKKKFAAEIETVRNQLFCFHTRKTFNEDTLGIPIAFERNHRTKNIQYISTTFDLLSKEAYYDDLVRKSVWKRPFSDWMPLYINRRHFEGTRDALRQSFMTLCDASTFKPWMVMDVLPKLMNTMVVAVMSGETHASIVALEGYCAFHHMFIKMVQEYPELQSEIETRIRLFIREEKYRTKTECPALGEFLPLLTVSESIQWKDVRTAYIQENFDRNALWIIKAHPQLRNPDQNYATQRRANMNRLDKSFETNKTSLRLLMFHVYFLTRIARVPGVPLSQVADNYDLFYGRPSAQMKERLQSYCKHVLSVSNWAGFFRTIGMNVPSPADVTFALNQAVVNSKRKGYHF